MSKFFQTKLFVWILSFHFLFVYNVFTRYVKYISISKTLLNKVYQLYLFFAKITVVFDIMCISCISWHSPFRTFHGLVFIPLYNLVEIKTLNYRWIIVWPILESRNRNVDHQCCPKAVFVGQWNEPCIFTISYCRKNFCIVIICEMTI